MTFINLLFLSAALGVYYAKNPKSKLHPLFGKQGWYGYSVVCGITGIFLLVVP